jgi:hypothetical protein
MRWKDILLALLKNNSGVSAKNFMLIFSAVFTLLFSASFITLEFMRFYHNPDNFTIDYVGWGVMLGGQGSLWAAIIWGKIKDNPFHSKSLNDELQ